MTMTKNALRVGLAQLPNDTNISANTARVVTALRAFSDAGADLVVFPEAALTGFTAQPEPCGLDALTPHVEAVREVARSLGVAVVLPSTVREETGYVNTGWIFLGERALRFAKVGLTESERRFFEVPEHPGARVFSYQGARLGLLLCREVGDAPDAYFRADDVDVVLWPGYCRWDDAQDWGPGMTSDMGGDAYRCVDIWERPLLQANFCHNAGADVRARGPNGRGCVVSSSNLLLHQGPTLRASGVLVTCANSMGVWDVVEARDLEIPGLA